MERQLLTYPTWERYTVLAHCIAQLSLRDRRRILQIARRLRSEWKDVFLPSLGITLTEFAVWYTLGEKRKDV